MKKEELKKSKNKAKNSKKSDNTQKLLDTINNLEKQVEDLNNKLLMALADYQNLVKSVERQKDQLINVVKRDVFSDLIDLFTDLYLSVKVLDEKAKKDPYVQGILKIIEKYKNLLKKYNVEEITFKKGDPIDLNLVQIIAYETDNKYKNQVCKVVEPGYKIGDLILRPARIIAYK